MLSTIKVDYVAIYHPDWIGVSNSTRDTFKYCIPLREQYTRKEAKAMAKAIAESGKKIIIFNAFANGWDMLCEELKSINNSIEIRVIIHGSPALFVEYYDWEISKIIFNLYKIINKPIQTSPYQKRIFLYRVFYSNNYIITRGELINDNSID